MDKVDVEHGKRESCAKSGRAVASRISFMAFLKYVARHSGLLQLTELVSRLLWPRSPTSENKPPAGHTGL